MAKEITIKVNVQGQDLVLTGKQVELLQGNLASMREELTKLGERTEENGQKFDKLRGDIQQLEKVFGETKEEVKKTGDEIQNQGNKSEESGKKNESYARQIAKTRLELIALGERTAENAVQYDALTAKIQTLSDQQEDLQFGTKKLDDALAAIPGPIGQAANAFKGLDDGLKNLKSAFATVQRDLKGTIPSFADVKKGFSDFADSVKNFKIGDLSKGFKSLMPTLDGVKSGVMGVGKALAASGIGAIAIVVGLLAAAFIKVLASSKPLQDALGRFGVLFEVLQDAVKPVVDIIAGALAEALDFLAKAIAFVSGNLDEYNKKLADDKAAKTAADNLAKLNRDFEANSYKYDEFTQRKMKADLDYQNKKAELNQKFLDGEIKTQAELNKLLSDYSAKRDFEIDQADKDRQAAEDEKAKAAAEKAKAAAEQRAQIEKDYQNKLKAIRDENTLLEITDENEKAKKSLEIQLENQLKEINALKVSDAKKEELRKQTNKKFELLEKQRQDKVIADQKKADEDILKTIRDGETAREQNEFRRAEKEAENRKKDAEKALQDSKASAEKIAAAKLEIEKQYQSDLAKIKEDEAKKTRETAKKIFDIDTETQLANIENRLMMADMSTRTEVEKLQERQKILAEQRQLNFNKELSDLKVLLDNKELNEDQYNAKVLEKTTAFNLQKNQFEIQNEEDIRQKRFEVRTQMLNDLITLAGEETAVGRALLVAKQLLAAQELFLEIRKTITFSKQSATRSAIGATETVQQATQAGAKATVDVAAGTAATARIGFPQNIPMLIGYAVQAAGIIAAIVSAIKAAKGSAAAVSKAGEGANAAAATPENFGVNYERGGMINGPRHAQGGVMIEAEGGEAVMSRGAVTMFKPMLSMMNQMGGGTSFNSNIMTRPDVASVSEPAREQSPMVMKTYVVSNELTNEAEKQARLKDLSTL